MGQEVQDLVFAGFLKLLEQITLCLWIKMAYYVKVKRG